MRKLKRKINAMNVFDRHHEKLFTSFFLTPRQRARKRGNAGPRIRNEGKQGRRHFLRETKIKTKRGGAA